MPTETSARPMTRESLARIKRYRAYLANLLERGCEFVTCSQLADATGVSLETLLDDLHTIQPSGELAFELDLTPSIAEMDRALGWDKYNDVFVAGAGHLAKALLGSEKLRERGLNVVAVFDDSPGLVGSTLNGYCVLPFAKMPDLARRMHVHIGIIAVDGDNAQAVADLMVCGGIEGIVCWSNAAPNVPDSVSLVHQDFAAAACDLVNSLAARA